MLVLYVHCYEKWACPFPTCKEIDVPINLKLFLGGMRSSVISRMDTISTFVHIETTYHNMTTSLGSLVDIIGSLHDHVSSTRILNLILNMIFIRTPKSIKESNYGLDDLDLVTISRPICCFISKEKWATWKIELSLFWESMHALAS